MGGKNWLPGAKNRVRYPLRHEYVHDFLELLELHRELIRIGEVCSPYLEISALTSLAAKSQGGGKALLFERVAGSDFPVLTNAFGSERRITLALGTEDLDSLGQRLQEILQQKPPRDIREKLGLLRKMAGWARFLPRTVRMNPAPCQEVVFQGEEVDLSILPVLTTWPNDAGPFVTLPVVFTRSLESGKRNAGMYRLQIFDRNTTGIHWHIHKDGAHYFHEHRKSGRRMEVAVAIGTDPAVTYAATAPLPRGIDEMLLAGFIRQSPVKMVKCLTVDLEVPASSEIVLEGYVDPHESRLEGPFGDHTGYYSPADHYPVFHVRALTHRRGAIYSATVVGRPPMEDCYLALATERLFLPLLKTLLPEVCDYWLPWEGVFHNLLVVAIEKTYPRQGWKVIQALWGSGQMSFCKVIVVVDEQVRLRDKEGLMKLLLSTIDLNRDLLLTEGILDVLDHAAPQACFGGKLGIDLTGPISGEEERAVPQMPPGPGPEIFLRRILDGDTRLRAGRVLFARLSMPLFLLAAVKGEEEPGSRLASRLLQDEILPPRALAILFDLGEDLEDNSLLFFRVANNVDPKRDIYLDKGKAVINAMKKGPADGHLRSWPEDAVMDEEIKQLALTKAKRLGII